MTATERERLDQMATAVGGTREGVLIMLEAGMISDTFSVISRGRASELREELNLTEEARWAADVALANLRTAAFAVYEAGLDGDAVDDELNRAWDMLYPDQEGENVER